MEIFQHSKGSSFECKGSDATGDGAQHDLKLICCRRLREREAVQPENDFESQRDVNKLHRRDYLECRQEETEHNGASKNNHLKTKKLKVSAPPIEVVKTNIDLSDSTTYLIFYNNSAKHAQCQIQITAPQLYL